MHRRGCRVRPGLMFVAFAWAWSVVGVVLGGNGVVVGGDVCGVGFLVVGVF